MSVLGQETVARMNRLDVAHFRSADHLIDLEVALRRLGRPHANGVVGQIKIGTSAIGLAENCDRFNPHFATGTDNP